MTKKYKVITVDHNNDRLTIEKIDSEDVKISLRNKVEKMLRDKPEHPNIVSKWNAFLTTCKMYDILDPKEDPGYYDSPFFYEMIHKYVDFYNKNDDDTILIVKELHPINIYYDDNGRVRVTEENR